jgi:hypothetical protein
VLYHLVLRLSKEDSFTIVLLVGVYFFSMLS